MFKGLSKTLTLLGATVATGASAAFADLQFRKGTAAFKRSKLRIKTEADKTRMAAAEAKRARKAAKLRGSQK